MIPCVELIFAVQALGDYDLHLLNGLCFTLKIFCFLPNLTRNIISVVYLKQVGFAYHFNDGFIHAYKNGVFYCEARTLNGIYEVNIESSLNNSFIYHANTKRLKYDLSYSYL